MSQLGTFFHGTDTRLGVFYPEHSLIAIFPDLAQAAAAKGKLRGAGFSDDEILAAPGADLADLVREESAKKRRARLPDKGTLALPSYRSRLYRP